MKSRTQGSRLRPRTQKQSKAKDSLSEDRPSRCREQECSRPRTKDTGASVLKKKVFKIFFRRSPEKKNVFKIFFRRFPKKRSSKIFFRLSTKFYQFKKYCCPRTKDRAIFENLRLQDQGLDLQGQGLQNVSSRTPPTIRIVCCHAISCIHMNGYLVKFYSNYSEKILLQGYITSVITEFSQNQILFYESAIIAINVFGIFLYLCFSLSLESYCNKRLQQKKSNLLLLCKIYNLAYEKGK